MSGSANKISPANFAVQGEKGDNMGLVSSTSTETLTSSILVSNGMCILQYQPWFDAIRNNDKRLVEVILKENAKQSPNLLDGYFTYDRLEEGRSGIYDVPKTYRPSLTLHVAIASCAYDVIEVLLTHGYEVGKKDHNGNNVLHALAVVGAMNRTIGSEIVAMYDFLYERLGLETIERLLLTENNEMFRPFEYAAHMGAFPLMRRIFNTERIYKIKEERHGFTTYAWYDVTEYEDGRRIHRHPTALVTFGDKAALAYLADSQVEHYIMFRQWAVAKVKINLIPLFAWFLLRVALFVMYCVIDFNAVSAISTNCTSFPSVSMGLRSQEILFGITFSIACLMIIFDVVEIAAYEFVPNLKSQATVFGRKKQFMVNFFTYRICHMIYCILLAIVLVVMTNSRTEGGLFTAQLIRIMIPPLAVWSVLLFFQLLPSISKSLIAMEYMFKDMASFIIIFIVVLLPFMISAAIFVQENSTADGCVEEFKDLFAASYTIFRMTLNMYDLTVLSSQTSNIGILYGLHVLFVFVVGILLINFLIAQMSDTATNNAERIETLESLNKAALAVLTEYRLFFLLKNVYYMRMKRRFFDVLEDGRLCVVVQKTTVGRIGASENSVGSDGDSKGDIPKKND